MNINKVSRVERVHDHNQDVARDIEHRLIQAKALESNDKYEEALAEYKSVLNLDPSNGLALHGIVRSTIHSKGELEELVPYLKVLQGQTTVQNMERYLEHWGLQSLSTSLGFDR